MELQEVIFDTAKLRTFVDDNFVDIKLTKLEKTAAGHPLILLQFNKMLAPMATKFSCFGIPVDSLYIYQKSENEYCTYIILQIDKASFNKLSIHLGYPENVPKEDYIKRDFDFLFWPLKSFNMFVNKAYFRDSTSDTYIIQAYNMPYKEIFDKTTIY
ncbi:MAG TPA: hypothetical protein VK541_08505 [Pedobacter sp.]|uniref:hypothetical protein n=1 Tax=Pedobacter sp. TaxID=1411316 RepID=UPI002C24C403|nr:hypothetical protein [Pedobacter sp.]HMI02507.1 hypothetical protein [Pedobacter sp.]